MNLEAQHPHFFCGHEGHEPAQASRGYREVCGRVPPRGRSLKPLRRDWRHCGSEQLKTLKRRLPHV